MRQARGSPPSERSGGPARTIAFAITVVGVALAVVRMARIACESSRMQYSDYWPMLDGLLADDGGIRWRGLFETRNAHPVVIPKVLYLVNVGLTDGDNHGQAAIVLGLALVLVGLVGLMVRSTPGMGRATRVAMVVMSAFVVLAPQGTWSYAKAMSGTAWLTANAFVVAAIVAQQRDRRWLAPVLGLLACASYGTGLAVWPALAVAGALQHGRRWRVQWPVWAIGGLVTAIYMWWYVARPGERPSSGPVDAVDKAVTLVVGALATGRAGLAVALLALGAAGVSLWACRDRLAVAAPWVALVVFAGASALLIGRTRPGEDVGVVTFAAGLPSRYWTIVAWAWIGLVGLAVVALRDRSVRVAAPLALLVVVALTGRDVPRTLQGDHEKADLLAVAMQLGVADGARVGGGRGELPPMTERLRDIGHHPFDGSSPMGCGLLGEQVEVEPELPPGVEGSVHQDPLRGAPDVLHLSGTVTNPDGGVECVVVVDAEGLVVGTGPTRSWQREGETRVRAIAAPQFLLEVAVRLEPDGPLHLLPMERG